MYCCLGEKPFRTGIVIDRRLNERSNLNFLLQKWSNSGAGYHHCIKDPRSENYINRKAYQSEALAAQLEAFAAAFRQRTEDGKFSPTTYCCSGEDVRVLDQRRQPVEGGYYKVFRPE